jgi:hypothetical protein
MIRDTYQCSVRLRAGDQDSIPKRHGKFFLFVTAVIPDESASCPAGQWSPESAGDRLVPRVLKIMELNLHALLLAVG